MILDHDAADLVGDILEPVHQGSALFRLSILSPPHPLLGSSTRSPFRGGRTITSAAIVLSPLLGFFLALLLVLAVSWAFVRSTPPAVDNFFRSAQLLSAALYSLGHGGNDAQKTMGIIAVLLYSQGLLGEEATRLHHAARRCCSVAARGVRAAAGSAYSIIDCPGRRVR
jgi:Phosphate transporter family